MQEVPENKKMIIGGDLNGHIGKGRQGSERVNGGWGFRGRIKAGEKILKFLEAYDLAYDSCFKKRDELIITYKNSGNKSQVNFLLVKWEMLK